MTGKKGVYTRQKGLDYETRKALLLKHIADNADSGSSLAELCQVLPGNTRGQVQSMVRDLKREGKLVVQGATKAGRWFPAAAKGAAGDLTP